MIVSVIVPLCNEAEGLPQLAKRLYELQLTQENYRLEFVLVDDGSLDDSLAIARALFANSPEVKIVAHPRNLGLGAAIRTGWRAAKGEIVCTMDADCTYDPMETLKLIDAIEQGADIATGSPYHPLGGVANSVPWRLWLSRCASRLYRLVSREKLYTFTSLMRAYRRTVVKSIQFHENGFVSVAEILVRSIKAGYRVTEVPMVLHTRTTGNSKMKIARTIAAHLRLMARSIFWARTATKPVSNETQCQIDGIS